MNGGEKIIKDNVHGYIYIDVNYFDIIDTALFQRLKNIKQTSYESLYPSSTHSRFNHSLGTYHLGKQVIRNIMDNLGKDVSRLFTKEEKQSIIYTFETACLLHDAGHAPFSHTTEDFYGIKKMDDSIEHRLEYEEYFKRNKIGSFCYLDASLINELYKIYPSDKSGKGGIVENFKSDIRVLLRERAIKPHEKMSALLSLSQMLDIINTVGEKMTGSADIFNADLFVRCILGASYGELTLKHSFYNAVISLLNSDIIDVDKLDYILRDNFMSGYVNTGIDVERLIKSFAIIKEDKYCILAYRKNALSVIESVIRASDSSKRWIQNHPIILYDTYITQKCISEAFKVIGEVKKEKGVLERFFSMETLTFEGNCWAEDEFAFLASDLDVTALIKKAYGLCGNSEKREMFKEYFAREIRRRPLWKSEMEYKICFDFSRIKDENLKHEKVRRIIDSAVASIHGKRDENTGVGEYIFNERNYEEKLREFPEETSVFIKAVHGYYKRIGKPMDIVVLTANSYSSGIKKLDTNKIKIIMPDYNDFLDSNIVPYSELASIEDGSSSRQIFYMYSRCPIDVKEFIQYLYEAI